MADASPLLLPTTVIGSYAFPSWLWTSLEEMDKGSYGPTDIRETYDDAVNMAIMDQERAGVDIIDHADRIDEECIEAILDADSVVVPSMLWSERFLEFAESWDHDASPLPISEGFPLAPDAARARIRAVHDDFDYTCRAMPDAEESNSIFRSSRMIRSMAMDASALKGRPCSASPTTR